ncbi:MAG TPA: ATP-binding protein [Candidatus Dormibacteraeota bacterium]|nr:ATP-binding protein [Candidatus Dormibacteraeota bacterium]
MTPSLRGRLLALALGATALVWGGTVVVTWFDARDEVDEVMDAHLAQAAALLIVQLGEEIEDVELEHVPALHRDARAVAFQIWEHGRRLRLHSANAPAAPLGTGSEGFSDRTIDGQRWRVFSAWDRSRDFLVHVGERSELRATLVRRMVAGIVAPLLVALPLLALLLWWAVRRGLLPLQRLADEVGRRQPESLTPLDARAPREVVPLIEQLNRLFARIAQSLERERRFTADAAHELRTPVAAIKAQAQVARLAGGAAPRDHALAQVVAAADRAGRLVEQLLQLSRLESGTPPAFADCSLRPLAREVLAELAPQAIARRVALELDDGPEVVVRGVAELLGAQLRNLVDNGLRHGAARVRVRIESGAAAATVSVVDDGPGIAAAEREHVLQRFHRLASAGEGGSGLGLSIAQRIAEIHGGRMALSDGDDGRGLRVTVELPYRS